MSTETIIYEKQNGVAKITLNRPQALNAFTPEMNRAMLSDLESQLEYEAYLQEIAGRSADYDEGVQAFLEKRQPVFKGE